MSHSRTCKLLIPADKIPTFKEATDDLTHAINKLRSVCGDEQTENLLSAFCNNGNEKDIHRPSEYVGAPPPRQELPANDLHSGRLDDRDD